MIIFTHSTQGTFFSSGWGTAGHVHQRESGDVAVRCLTLPSIILASHESGLLTAESSDGGSCDHQQFLSPVCRSNTFGYVGCLFHDLLPAFLNWLSLLKENLLPMNTCCAEKCAKWRSLVTSSPVNMADCFLFIEIWFFAWDHSTQGHKLTTIFLPAEHIRTDYN